MLNLFAVLLALGEFKGWLDFIANVPSRDFHYFIMGMIELLVYYLVSLFIVYLSFHCLPVKAAAAVRIFCSATVCLLLDMLFCLFVYRLFFIV
ncbi:MULTISPECIES: hypothetical protein [Eikenella]|uniref:Uncharacterized protein n=1 Tax=Eikenella longinqua TaxID=1795827 RepID=A0A1A9S1Y3_9NEIS|nr:MULTISPECIES: hypothetical protein [Eikenella]OAM31066.1 hypothetical protein A7P95_00760 [Eikenella longinqua]